MKLNKNGIKVLTPSGFKKFDGIQKLKKECLELVFKTTSLKCSTNHKILTKSGDFKFSNELTVGEFIKTSNGYDEIIKIQNSGFLDVYDLLNVEGNQYYTNNIVSHNVNLMMWENLQLMVNYSMTCEDTQWSLCMFSKMDVIFFGKSQTKKEYT
jgi:hypothetical protein